MTGPLDAALGYAARGLAVFPVHYPIRREGGGLGCSCGDPGCASPAKHPYSPLASRGLKNATCDEPTIRKWWSSGSPFNIGLRTGAVTGIVVLDVDPRHGGDGALRGLEQRFGSLPATWRFLTGGGGEHILFRHPGGEDVPNGVGAFGDGLDVRADGGCIVAPPSRHISGRPYSVSVDHDPALVPLADLPAWLASLLCARARKPPATAPAMPEAWRNLVAEGVAEGRRNDAIARLAGHLLRKQVDPLVALDLTRSWNAARCRPPLPDREVVRTVNSICARELQRRGLLLNG
jgi:hypothetical protein